MIVAGRRALIGGLRILTGANAGGLPVEPSIAFELSITAIGLTLPPLLLLRAEGVIE